MKIFLFVFLIIIVSACSNKGHMNEENWVHSISINLNGELNISVFDIFSGIDIIPLETTTKSRINFGIYKLIPYNGYYYYMDRTQNSVFVFDGQGRFLKKIHEEQTSEKYHFSLRDFNFNRFTGDLELLSIEGRIHIYDWKGDVLKEVLQIPCRYLDYFANVNKDVDVFFSNEQTKGSKMSYYSRQQKRILNGYKDYTFPTSFLSIGLANSKSPFYIYQDNVYFHQVYNGAIYSIGLENNDLSSYLQWDFGSYNFDPSFIKEGQSEKYYGEYLNYEGSNYALLFFLSGENDKYLINNFLFKNQNKTIIFNKKNSKTMLVSSFDEGFSCMTDYMDEEYLYGLLPVKYLNIIDPNILNENNLKIYNLIKSEDNPVIIRFKFK